MGSNPVGDTMRRVLLGIAAPIAVIAICACKPERWTIDPELHVYAKPYRSAYASVAELANVAPGLDVEGTTSLHDAIAAKLTADGIGKAGRVLVELGAAAPTAGAGSLAVHVHINAAWGTGA